MPMDDVDGSRPDCGTWDRSTAGPCGGSTAGGRGRVTSGPPGSAKGRAGTRDNEAGPPRDDADGSRPDDAAGPPRDDPDGSRPDLKTTWQVHRGTTISHSHRAKGEDPGRSRNATEAKRSSAGLLHRRPLASLWRRSSE
ncbi:hypothetical protein ACRRTK_020065 [Alexandromys fortis]